MAVPSYSERAIRTVPHLPTYGNSGGQVRRLPRPASFVYMIIGWAGRDARSDVLRLPEPYDVAGCGPLAILHTVQGPYIDYVS